MERQIDERNGDRHTHTQNGRTNTQTVSKGGQGQADKTYVPREERQHVQEMEMREKKGKKGGRGGGGSQRIARDLRAITDLIDYTLSSPE